MLSSIDSLLLADNCRGPERREVVREHHIRSQMASNVKQSEWSCRAAQVHRLAVAPRADRRCADAVQL